MKLIKVIQVHWRLTYMIKKTLKNRTQFTNTLRNDLMDILNEYSDKTGITKSRLFDNAFEMYFKELGLLPKDKEN
jgi:hypothetical protein